MLCVKVFHLQVMCVVCWPGRPLIRLLGGLDVLQTFHAMQLIPATRVLRIRALGHVVRLEGRRRVRSHHDRHCCLRARNHGRGSVLCANEEAIDQLSVLCRCTVGAVMNKCHLDGCLPSAEDSDKLLNDRSRRRLFNWMQGKVQNMLAVLRVHPLPVDLQLLMRLGEPPVCPREISPLMSAVWLRTRGKFQNAVGYGTECTNAF